MLKRILLFVTFILSCSHSLANTEFSYSWWQDGYRLYGCVIFCEGNVVIPETIDGINVTSIIDNAFQYNGITSVTIPDSVHTIGFAAFDHNLITSVAFGNSVTSIAQAAFSSNRLTSVSLPDSLVHIGSWAFSGNFLTNMSLGNSITTIEYRAFSFNDLTSLTIPDSVTSIGEEAFLSNQISNIHFYGELPNIDSTAFSSNLLTSITYCQNNNGGWDDVVIEGITPVQDENCVSDDNAPENTINWDFDQSGNLDALTDGLLLLRYTFGLRSESLTSGAISAESALSQADVESNIEQALSIADIDNSGSVDALTDGLMLLRYAFGLRGESLISGAVSTQGLRNTATDIEAYIESHMP